MSRLDMESADDLRLALERYGLEISGVDWSGEHRGSSVRYQRPGVSTRRAGGNRKTGDVLSGVVTQCECGRGIAGIDRSRDGGCYWCRAMDGVGRQRDLIEVLRERGISTTAEIAFEMGMTHNTAQVFMARAMQRGQVVRRDVLGESAYTLSTRVRR